MTSAEDIQLKLAMRGIADRTSRFLYPEPRTSLPKVSVPTHTDMICSCSGLPATGTKQPASHSGFLKIFRAHKSEQRQSSVAHPQKSVIPVSMTANHLR